MTAHSETHVGHVPGSDFLQQDAIREAVRGTYAGVRPTDRRVAERFYGAEELRNLPEEAVRMALGVGNPVRHASLRPGESVLDLGSGGGIDCLIAARAVGPTGPGHRRRLPARDDRAGDRRRGTSSRTRRPHTGRDAPRAPRRGTAADRRYRARALGAGRIEGGRSLWTGCIAGGLLADQLEALVRDAGFTDVDLTPGGDVFAGAPQHSNAAAYGTRGVGIRARKAG